MNHIEYPITRQKVVELIDSQIDDLDKDFLNQRKKERFYRRLSWLTRLSALVFLSIGLVMPVAGMAFDDTFPVMEIAYGSLILSGLTLLVDQVFAHTDSWLTYGTAISALRSIREDLIFYKLDFSATAANDVFAQESISDVLQKLRLASENASTVKANAQADFVKKIRDGKNALQAKISESTPEARKKMDEEKAARDADADRAATRRDEVGLLEIEIANPEIASDLKLSVDENSIDWDLGRRSKVFADLSPGPTIFQVRCKIASKAYLSERVVRIIANEVVKTVVTLPALGE